MIELVQIPYSPYCIVQRRILEFAGVKFKTVNIPTSDRSLVWKLTRERYYAVPVVQDGRNVLFETEPDSQVIAKYLDQKFTLGLFPPALEGVQSILWRFIENEVEGIAFKLNDIHFEEFIPKRERVAFIRHKERKFGPACLEKWKEQQSNLLAGLEAALLPFEEMAAYKPFLIDERPRFVDFDLFGILGNFLFTGHYELPRRHASLKAWHQRMAKVRRESFP